MPNLRMPDSTKASKADTAKVKRMVIKCMNYLKRPRFELGLTAEDVKKAVALTIVTDRPNVSGGTSAGRESIRINMSTWQLKAFRASGASTRHMIEYKAFENDKTIGGLQCESVDHMLLAIVAHEVAHHVQYARGFYVPWLQKTYIKPHGEGFRMIYSILRAGLVNKP